MRREPFAAARLNRRVPIVGELATLRGGQGGGGGGEQAGSNNQGGGSGGLVVLGAGNRIELHTHGDTYAMGDYSFSVTADGGASTQSAFGGISIDGKYPPAPTAAYTASPSGGFGGLGIVQLLARIGNNADNTNTVLDDSIDVIDNGAPLIGPAKQRYLAWRGWPDANGTWVDDFGQPTANEGQEGDLRPAPILMPLF